MGRGYGWQIGRVLGIPIVVHGSWLLVFAFVTWTLATTYLPAALPGQTEARYWIMGGMAALLLFASVLLHELGHCWVALRYRIPIGSITLFVFGGVAQMRREPPTPKAEFLIAMAGPVVSLLLGCLCLGGVLFTEATSVQVQRQGLMVLGGLLGTVNVQIGLFNLIPGFPLDGGRVLRAGLWAWSDDFYAATRRSAAAGLVCGVLLSCGGGALMLAAGVGLLPASHMTTGTWVAMIGLFLFATARGSRQQAAVRGSLALVPVGDLMARPVVGVPSDLSVASAVTRYFLPHGYSGFPVIQGDKVVGLVTIQDLHRLPKPLWVRREVREVMRPLEPVMILSAEQSALQALEQMATADMDRLLVMDNERLIGLVTRSSVWRYLRLRARGE